MGSPRSLNTNRILHQLVLLGYFLLSCHHHLPSCRGQVICSALGGCDAAGRDDRLPIYIVFVRKPEHMLSATPEELERWHRSFLPTANLTSGEPRMVYSYSEAISGFAARLNPEEVGAMEAKPGFLYARRDERLLHQTTRTPEFLSLRPQVWAAANRGEGVIIGVVDSGINPAHISFDGTRFPPQPPPRWRGFCEFNNQRVCNSKLLGARNYDAAAMQVEVLPVDTNGHGTHVASTVAGNEVVGAGIRGLARGTASGSAPGAYLAIYKAQGTSEILAAIDQAIKDGVDILSISMLPITPHLPFFQDLLAIGALSAVRNGILVSCCAANYGPLPRTLRNDAPWIMTVGASTTDRALRVRLWLGYRGGQEVIQAESLYTGPRIIRLPLLFPGENGDPASRSCALLPFDVSGSAVLCAGDGDSRTQAEAVANAGAAAVILMYPSQWGTVIPAIPDVATNIPVVAVTYADSARLLNYMRVSAAAGTDPVVSIEPRGTVLGVHPYPAVAHFSSRGPSAVNGGILKPDVLGPGVNILAASPNRGDSFFLESGTSMATPHLSGIAAIVLNSSNWAWSPAMIRSAIMTTSVTTDSRGLRITDETGFPANLFAAGAGQVNPPRVNDPGLVYDVGYNDYVRYLCGLGYSDRQVSVVASAPVVCAGVGGISAEQLNYPSISVTLQGASPGTVVVQREVTNVGPPFTAYTAVVDLPPAVWADVRPRRLRFKSVGQKIRFNVTLRVANPVVLRGASYLEGQLRWVSACSRRVVASPLLVTIV